MFNKIWSTTYRGIGSRYQGRCNIAIRVQQADVGDFARMGLLAGKSIAAVRGEEQEFRQGLQTQAEQSAADRQMTALTAAAKQQQLSIAADISQQEFAAESQQIALAMQAQAAEDRQRIALENQRDMQEFDAFMATQSQQRSQAWELEKVEMSARNRFELNEQAYAMEFQATEANKIRTSQETQQKIAAINKARADLGDKTADALILSLETGISQVATKALRPANLTRELLARSLSGDPSNLATNLPQQESYETFNTASQLLAMRPDQDPETQREIDQILRERNPQTMGRALETLGGSTSTTQPIAVSSDANFLKARISLGEHSVTTNKVMQEAISREDPREMKAVVTAVQSIEEDERRAETKAAARTSQIARNREIAKQEQITREMREALGVSDFSSRMGSAAAAFPSSRVGF